MRTTLTLDADVAARLARVTRKRRAPFKTIVNEALRAGLDAVERAAVSNARFRTRGFELGTSLIGSLDNVEEALAWRGRAARVILVDANLLLYAANRSAPEHERARTWLDNRLSGTVRVGLPWPSLLAFVRLASNPLVVSHPVTAADAWRQVEEWLASEVAWTPVPGESHAGILRRLLSDSAITSRLVLDAHLAALAIEHGLTLCSTDGDFARFPELTWHNPLGAGATS
jgi:toxin-antitoxin system PIN domain toxin